MYRFPSSLPRLRTVVNTCRTTPHSPWADLAFLNRAHSTFVRVGTDPSTCKEFRQISFWNKKAASPQGKGGKIRSIRKTPFQRTRFQCLRRLIFPDSFPPSIFSTAELNFCVRNGNRWILSVIDPDYGVGDDLSFQAASRQVFSAQLSLTSVFGMGTGGSSV